MKTYGDSGWWFDLKKGTYYKSYNILVIWSKFRWKEICIFLFFFVQSCIWKYYNLSWAWLLSSWNYNFRGCKMCVCVCVCMWVHYSFASQQFQVEVSFLFHQNSFQFTVFLFCGWTNFCNRWETINQIY